MDLTYVAIPSTLTLALMHVSEGLPSLTAFMMAAGQHSTRACQHNHRLCQHIRIPVDAHLSCVALVRAPDLALCVSAALPAQHLGISVSTSAHPLLHGGRLRTGPSPTGT